jgi:TPP-dependent pyruvate/acetoin dehydrogenase alpha subunit
MAVENIADRAAAYEIPGVIVDGNDVLAVYQSARRAIARAREGLGPSLIECKTFRMTGHSAHDDAGYVPREMFEEWESRDPIDKHEKYLVEHGILSAEELQGIRKDVVREIDEAVEWAEQNPYPEPQDCLRSVYQEENMDNLPMGGKG